MFFNIYFNFGSILKAISHKNPNKYTAAVID